MSIVVSHAGSASNPTQSDGPRRACLAGLQTLTQAKGSLKAAIAATRWLEDDARFNAGTGSNLRLDGTTVQMDASCMTSGGDFAAVAAIERVRNPVAVAERLLSTPHVLLVGEGATAFARRCGFADYDPATPAARERFRQVMAASDRAASDRVGEWSRAELERVWNFATPSREAWGSDTVGSVVWDGETFAGALSSGGTTTVLLGRVGDVPLPGCGLYVGEGGAVAATGDGEHIGDPISPVEPMTSWLQVEPPNRWSSGLWTGTARVWTSGSSSSAGRVSRVGRVTAWPGTGRAQRLQ